MLMYSHWLREWPNWLRGSSCLSSCILIGSNVALDLDDRQCQYYQILLKKTKTFIKLVISKSICLFAKKPIF